MFLSVSSGKRARIPLDPVSDRDQRMLDHMEGWERHYGDTKLSTRTETALRGGGSIEWRDVFLKVGDQRRRNVSECDGVDCGQPSLSSVGDLVVFVKAPADASDS